MNASQTSVQTSVQRIFAPPAKATPAMLVVGLLVGALLVFAAPGVAAAPLAPTRALATTPPLGTAASFAVLAATTVTNTGATVVTGDLGVSPGTAVTGFSPGIVNGTIHSADATSLQAQADATTAYTNAAGQACNTDLTGQDLGGQTLTAAVYCFSSSAQLTGNLVLNGQGNSGGVFIFQMGSTITTASNATVSFINGANACNVYWQVGSSATLGTGTTFAGNILALTSITATTGVTSNGGLYALTGAVTLDTNRVNTCAPTTTPPPPTCTLTYNAPNATVGGQVFIAGKTVLTLRGLGSLAVQSLSYRFYREGTPIPAYKVVNGSKVVFDLGDLEILDGTYILECYATDVESNVGPVTTTTLVLDQHAPRMKAQDTGGIGHRNVTLTATDTGSGVATIHYRAYRKGTTAPAYTIVASDHVSFTLVGPPGTYFVDFYAVDAVTNQMASQRATIIVTA